MTKKLDKLWIELIRLIHGGRCALCLFRGGDAHHLIKRKTHGGKYRYEPKNGVLLCRMHHIEYDDNPTGLLPKLPVAQQEWYSVAVEDKRFVKLDQDAIEESLKAAIDRQTKNVARCSRCGYVYPAADSGSRVMGIDHYGDRITELCCPKCKNID